MKKRIILLTIVLLSALAVEAKPVGMERARTVGANYLNAISHSINGALKEATTPFSGFYVFNAGEQGFVIVAADDCVRPILGYSLTNTFRVENMPTNVKGLLEDYEACIVAAKESEKHEGERGHNSRANAIAEEWRQLSTGSAPEQLLSTAVSPLLTTTWNQSPYYNDMCPYDNTYGQNAIAGCVAVSAAQVMKYWNHPATGYGSHSYTATNSYTSYGELSADFGNTSYDWNNMPDALTSASSQTEINAVAQLLYHVGVAIEMDYSVNFSSAYDYRVDGSTSPASQFALVEYFKYSPDISVLMRSDYDDETFCSLLRAELDQNRPIIFDGNDGTSGGHSFVLDGYNQYNYFHVNWGWGSYCDGYYMMGALNPTPGGSGGNSSGTYNHYNGALIGIRPNSNFGNGGTVTLSTTGGNPTCSVTGSGTYVFGDTATIAATAGEGYRFVGWSDNCRLNPRTMFMTGGNYSFTARFEPISGDTISYCGHGGEYSSWGEYQQGIDKYWGIKIPESSLTPGRTLKAVEFYVGYYYGGNYDVTVYSGTTAPTDTVYSTSVRVYYSDRYSWYSVFLPNPYTVETGKNLWLTFHNSDLTFPATTTSSCGNPDGFLYSYNTDNNASFNLSTAFPPDPEWNKFTFMIRGRFDDPGVVARGDTLSYCNDKPYFTSSECREWGIMIPAADLAGRNYLKSVKLFPDYSGIYTLHVYKGGNDAPGILVHTQPADINTYGWQDILLDSTIGIAAGDSLWITFSCPDNRWPATSCRYTGNPNSNWENWGDSWYHQDSYSWLIKAVTSATAPVLPSPTVAIRGERYVGINTSATFTAAHTTGVTVNWTIQGVNPSTYTGDTVTVAWNAPGWYQVYATVSNSHGDSSDYMWVYVVDCDQAISSYPYWMGFEENENMVCIATLDADNDGSGWGIEYNGYDSQRAFRSNGMIWNGNEWVQTNVDNWFFLPKMITRAGAGYSLEWYEMNEMSDNTNNPHYGVFIDTTGGTNPANYVLVAEFNNAADANNWYHPRSLDLSAYAGKTFRLAFRHYNAGTNNIYIDNITVNENILFFREGDTISYCGWRNMQGGLSYTSGTTRWGVMFPSSRLIGCDTLKSVLLFVNFDGNYTLNISQEGADAPGTFIRSVDTVFNGQYGWQEFVLNPALPLDGSHPLWVTFLSNAYRSAVYTQFSGDYNSNWLSGDGINWVHATDYNYNSSWMIKAVTAASAGAADCANISLPYDADFTQCWTANGGASIVDATHATINTQGQELVSPWFTAQPGKVFVAGTFMHDEDWEYDQDCNCKLKVIFEDEQGIIDERELCVSTWWEFSIGAETEGGLMRVRFEYIGSAPMPTLQISDVAIFNYDIDITIDVPDMATEGDTITITSHLTLPAGASVSAVYSRHISYYNTTEGFGDYNDTVNTVLSHTDSSITMVLHALGEYYFSAGVSVSNAYQNHEANADAWTYVTYYYIEDSIYYSSSAKTVVIGSHPDLHYAVIAPTAVSIEDEAFYNHNNLTDVDLPDGLQRIGHMAFAQCPQLTEVTIPHAVQWIGDNAFWNCTSLEVLNFNADSCTTMSPSTADNGSYWPVFVGCGNLHTINIGENVRIIPDRAFWGSQVRGRLVIPNSVVSIGYDAFYHYSATQQGIGDTLCIVLGSALQSIGDNCFPSVPHKLHTVISLNPVPPSRYDASFYVDRNFGHLIVPCGSAAAYSAAPYWSEFIISEDCTGIEDIADDELTIIAVEGGIIVKGARNMPVEVYDVMGRKVAAGSSVATIIPIDRTGVYMVRVGEYPARKVVVIK